MTLPFWVRALTGRLRNPQGRRSKTVVAFANQGLLT
jgi:hypothetical protein